jgi:hypothetical protein
MRFQIDQKIHNVTNSKNYHVKSVIYLITNSERLLPHCGGHFFHKKTPVIHLYLYTIRTFINYIAHFQYMLVKSSNKMKPLIRSVIYIGLPNQYSSFGWIKKPL